ncbi:MAG: hypothetical protein P8Y64_11290 [Gammaproteobacteria bacterium]|jgi:hypothetical protein
MTFHSRLLRLVRLGSAGEAGDCPLWYGMEEVPALQAALQGQRYYRLNSDLETLRKSNAEAWALSLQAIAVTPVNRMEFDWWVGESSHLAEPWLVRALRVIRDLSDDRSVSPSSLTVVGLMHYFKQLEQAERDLAEAAQRMPDCAEPWAWLLYTGLLAGMDEETLSSRFAEATMRDPQHLMTHVFRVRVLSDEQDAAQAALRFAREVSDASPYGHALHALIAQAWIEAWSWWIYIDGPDRARQRLMAPEVVAEINAAYQRMEMAPGSLYRPVPYGFFGLLFYLMKQREPAWECLQAMGDTACGYPWTYLREHAADFLGASRIVERVRAEVEGLPA